MRLIAARTCPIARSAALRPERPSAERSPVSGRRSSTGEPERRRARRPAVVGAAAAATRRRRDERHEREQDGEPPTGNASQLRLGACMRAVATVTAAVDGAPAGRAPLARYRSGSGRSPIRHLGEDPDPQDRQRDQAADVGLSPIAHSTISVQAPRVAARNTNTGAGSYPSRRAATVSPRKRSTRSRPSSSDSASAISRGPGGCR